MPTLSDATNDEIADEIARRIIKAEMEAERAAKAAKGEARKEARLRVKRLKAAHRRLDAARQMLIGGGDIQPFTGSGLK